MVIEATESAAVAKAGADNLPHSVQTRSPGGGTVVADNLAAWLNLAVFGTQDVCPPYWSEARDVWLRKFIRLPGNDLLAGAIATIAAKLATTRWTIEGPLRAVNYARQMMQMADFGAGYSSLTMKGAWDYLIQDKGWWMERIRRSRTDRQGSALGFAHFDAAKIRPLRTPDYPAEYRTGAEEDNIKLHASQVIHILDCHSPEEARPGIGFCAASRAYTTAMILIDIAIYDRQRLSDLPPAGLLLINNMQQQEWADLVLKYETGQRQQGNSVWRDIMVAFSLDPTAPLSAEIFSFSNMPEHFDRRTSTEIAVYSFALALRIDPREIWPVSAGPLGTAAEANIQHLKARGKGVGMLLTDFERAMNDGLSLPSSVVFRFDSQDTEEDLTAVRIVDMKARFLRRLWEPSSETGEGMISTSEARGWLITQGIFNEEDLSQEVTTEQATDIEVARAGTIDLGPRVRYSSDGRMISLRRKSWPVVKTESYRCECLKCGHKVTSKEHCVDIVCPRCGGTMRRASRPGVGRTSPLYTAAEAYIAGDVGPEDLANYAIALAVEAQQNE